MRTVRNVRVAIGVAVLAGVVGICAASRGDDAVPRYQFVVGQELDYQGRSIAEHQDHPQMDITDTTLKVWVVRENPDHTFHLIVLSDVKNGAAKDTAKNPPVANISQLDLSADGNTPDNAATAGDATPEVFPPLPHDAAAMSGWENADEATGQRTVFKPLQQRDRGEFLFNGTQTSSTDPIYQTASSATFHFDWSKGLIAHLETKFSQGYGVNITGTGKVDLQQVATGDANFMKQLSNEADIYFAAAAAVANDNEIAAADPAQTEAKLADATKVLSDAQGKITLPMFKDQLDGMVKSQPDSAGFIRDTAKQRAELLAGPPLEWSTTDLDGQPATAPNFRGKVQIVNFWSRGVPWSIAELPAVKALATDFANDPVWVLGMNAGDDVKDAQFVVQQMGLMYPQLKGDALANQLKINELPTVLVVDQTGKIQNIFMGFSPTLHEDVSKAVKALLK